MACIEARGLRKSFGTTIALDGIDLQVEEGRILGLVGPNGAGKTTALNAILGLIPYQGELRVLGRDPWTERDQLMRDVCFIADVAVLPRWMQVSQALEFLAGVHPRLREDVITAIRELHRSGRTFVVVDHDMESILRISRRLVVMARGRKIADGEPAAVRADQTVLAAYTGL